MKPLRLGLPKGHMQEAVVALLGDAGIRVRAGARSYRPTLSLPGFEAKMLKPQNIVEMLHAGSRDLGFAGRDWVVEKGVDLVELVERAPRVRQLERPDLDHVAHPQAVQLLHPRPADEGPVGAALVEDDVLAPALAERRVAAAHARVGEADLAALVAADDDARRVGGAASQRGPHRTRHAPSINTAKPRAVAVHQWRSGLRRTRRTSIEGSPSSEVRPRSRRWSLKTWMPPSAACHRCWSGPQAMLRTTALASSRGGRT